ncbi:MAG TPA: SDR family oxidoreductase [Methyloceanibacter sp.]|nr:SDR family oxidoreductase [Methyloceanibacter sp.]
MNESNLQSDPSIALPAAVITGATEGIGRALAEAFARDGHALVLVARDHAKLAKTAEALARAHGVEVKVTAQDLSTPEGCAGVEQAVRRFGFYAEFLVNNAGIMSSGFFQDEDPATVRRIVDLNVRAMVDLTIRFLPGMLARGRGGVLNLSSMMGYMPVPYQATYAASKAFILSFSKALSYETRSTGVKVSVVAPGVVSTGLHDKAGAQNSRYLVWFPPLTPEQVANKAYRRFKRGWSVTMPGLINPLGAFAARLTPDFALIPLMGWFFRQRDDEGNVLWPRPLEKPPESKRAPEPKRLETAD